MKRDHSYHYTAQESDSSGGDCSTMWSAAAAAAGAPSCGGSADADLDELFAAVGYKLRSSDMADVALKIEQLDQAMEQQQAAAAASSSTAAAEANVHYNPSDLSSWLESMITVLNPPDELLQPDPFRDFGSDLISIPGKAAVPSPSPPPQKKLKTAADDPVSAVRVDPPRPVVIVDSQENGIRLVHTLMACADAVQREDLTLAEALVKNIGFLAVSQPGAMRKVATYFAEALARRIYNLRPAVADPQDFAFSDMLEMHFYESCPYLKFAHFTANQAILEAISGKNKVHVIDFGIKQGMQWPALMQALALRPNGPPTFRLTGIGPPSHDGKDHLQEVGWKLAQLAETVNIEFEYRGFVASSLADLHESMFDVREGETVCANSIFELHQMLARPNNNGVEKLLRAVRALRPEIFTVVEQEANHNGQVFADRFTEALHYYSTVFDSLESSAGGGEGGVATDQDRVMSEVYLGRQICNVVACEGSDRVERHETLDQWRIRFGSAGFRPVHLGSSAYKQASMLLALYADGDGYRVEENGGCLMLGWHTRPLIATSAWKVE